MNAINGLMAAWQGIGAAWTAFWGLLSPIGDQVTLACVKAAPRLCVWLDEGWMQIMGYHLLMNCVIFGSVNAWYCWKLYQMDKSVTWYYPDTSPRDFQAAEPTKPRASEGSDKQGLYERIMAWLGLERD